MHRPPTSTGSPSRRAPAEAIRRAGRAAGLAAGFAALLAALAPLASAAGPSLLPADRAFRLSARALDAQTLEIRFNVADGYYLYRDKLRFRVEPDSAGSGTPTLPPGKVIEDEFFGRVATYRGLVVIRLPLAAGAPGQSVTLVADSQGCADAGVCYPPQLQRLTLPLPAAGAGPTVPVEAGPPAKPYFN
ncbi:Thiol:disulfide interchange protein DsbD [Burkholderiales bacterium]|nr:Thiol:disulfide interchange protein DsbD [Burkholderiales bacterium]